MIALLFQGEIILFALIVIALLISLTLHEWGHAFSAKCFGDNTAQQMGRLTLNPMAHIDPVGLLMVLVVGFGYAKPVPTNPANYRSRWADFWVAGAGPFMNLVAAFFAINILVAGQKMEVMLFYGHGAVQFFSYLAIINIALMIFNLIPLGALDGHYMLPYFLRPTAAMAYLNFNARYGNMALMGLILLSAAGLPIFAFVFKIGAQLIPFLQIV